MFRAELLLFRYHAQRALASLPETGMRAELVSQSSKKFDEVSQAINVPIPCTRHMLSDETQRQWVEENVRRPLASLVEDWSSLSLAIARNNVFLPITDEERVSFLRCFTCLLQPSSYCLRRFFSAASYQSTFVRHHRTLVSMSERSSLCDR